MSFGFDIIIEQIYSHWKGISEYKGFGYFNLLENKHFIQKIKIKKNLSWIGIRGYLH